LAVPELLRQFPESTAGDHLRNLRQLLGVALMMAPECLTSLALHKLGQPQLHVEQQLLWLAVQMLVGDPKGEDAFWQRLDEAGEADIAMLLTAELVMQGIQLQALQTSQPERILGRLIESIAP